MKCFRTLRYEQVKHGAMFAVHGVTLGIKLHLCSQPMHLVLKIRYKVFTTANEVVGNNTASDKDVTFPFHTLAVVGSQLYN